MSYHNLSSGRFCETKGFALATLVTVGCIVGASKNPPFGVLHHDDGAVLSAQISLLAVDGGGIFAKGSYISNQVTIII